MFWPVDLVVELTCQGLVVIEVSRSVAVELCCLVAFNGSKPCECIFFRNDEQARNVDVLGSGYFFSADWAVANAWMINAGLAEGVCAIDEHLLVVVGSKAEGANDDAVVVRFPLIVVDRGCCRTWKG